MGKFDQISLDAFKEMQLNAGMLLNKFDPSTGAVPADEDIICATTGGITASCVPTYSDLGEDVDNCPNNMMELMQIEGWACKLAATALSASAESIRMSLGAADVDAETGKITPRHELKNTDFKDVWWVGDRADGGMVAVRLMNALSSGGFNLKTTKKGKGQFSIELSGHVSIQNQDVVPMEFYSQEGVDAV